MPRTANFLDLLSCTTVFLTTFPDLILLYFEKYHTFAEAFGRIVVYSGSYVVIIPSSCPVVFKYFKDTMNALISALHI